MEFYVKASKKNLSLASRLLLILEQIDSMTPGKLAQNLGIKTSYIGGIVSALRKAGWIIRSTKVRSEGHHIAYSLPCHTPFPGYDARVHSSCMRWHDPSLATKEAVLELSRHIGNLAARRGLSEERIAELGVSVRFRRF